MVGFPFFFHLIIHVLLTSDRLLIQALSGSKRLTLIIGNSLYGENFPGLENAGNDAQAIKEKLKSLGFAINEALFVTQGYFEMLEGIEDFPKRIHKNVTDIV